jgi:hypothetical protein
MELQIKEAAVNFKLKTSLIIGAIVASSLVYAATVISFHNN